MSLNSSSFWGVKLSPGQIFAVSLPESAELRITNACIYSSDQTSNFSDNYSNTYSDNITHLYARSDSHLIECEPGTCDWILLATFIPNKIEHQVLHFVMKNGTLQNRGLSTLYVCGTTTSGGENMIIEEEEEEEEEPQFNTYGSLGAFGL